MNWGNGAGSGFGCGCQFHAIDGSNTGNEAEGVHWADRMRAVDKQKKRKGETQRGGD